PRVDDFLGQRQLLFSLVRACGSPLYVSLPVGFEHNVALFREVFERCGVEGRVWYAYKVNKTKALLEAAAHQNIGADVSSLSELRLALGHGIPGNQIGVSGPLKDARLLLLAMQHPCIIVLD